MPDVNFLALLVATFVVFVLSSTYYAVFGEQLGEVSDAAAAGEQPPPWKLAIQLLGSLIVAAVGRLLSLSRRPLVSRRRSRRVSARRAPRAGPACP